MKVTVDRLDHLVLTVRNIRESCNFYTAVLGMREVTFAAGRKALAFGTQKINLHEQENEIELKAHRPEPGSADLCFITDAPLERVVEHLRACGVEIIGGPVERTGAKGALMSVYFRDPDLNLIEVSNYVIGLAEGGGHL